MRTFRLWLILAALLAIVLPAGAQDSAAGDQPLLDMLALVPDSPEARASIVSYVDYRAVEAARSGAAQPESWADWQATRRADADAYELWVAAFTGVNSGPNVLLTTLQEAEAWPAILGFDFFDVDRALEYGQPPSLAQILYGDFDAGAIVAAYEAASFSAETVGDLTLLCGSTGCENGMQINLNNRNPANPFGGMLGRQEPLLIAPGHLVDSANSALIDQHSALLQGERPSLADDPQFQAAARAVTREGLLRQAQLVNADMLGVEGESSEPIPSYGLLVLADAATDSEQVTTVGLVYAGIEEAQAAAAALPGRIENYTTLASSRALTDMLAERDAGYTVDVFEDTASETAVALVVLRAPLAGAYEADGWLPSSSQIYRMLMQMLYQRDLGWIAP